MTPRTFSLLLLTALSLQGCGGGGSDAAAVPTATQEAETPAPPPEPVGISVDRSGLVIGTITGFGSIFVNGVEYDTETATILDDGRTIAETDLAVGDLVTVEGAIDEDGATGTAARVIFDAEVEGPVASLDVANARFVVLGRTVQVDGATVFAPDIVPRAVEGLAVGDRVEVSGLLAGDGAVLATRIERSDDPDLEVKGFVAALDTAAATFRLGDLVVAYGNARLDDFEGASLAEGQLVDVRGRELDADGALEVIVVELEDDTRLVLGDAQEDDAQEGDARRFEIEGVITAVDGDIVTVATLRVRIAEDARFERGDRSDLVVGARLEIEGAVAADGSLVADRIEPRVGVDSEIEGRVTAVDPDGGTLELLGIAVRVNATTQFEDDSAAAVRRFSLADLAVGDFVEVKGNLVAGVLEAVRIERDDEEEAVSDPGEGDGDEVEDDDGDDQGASDDESSEGEEHSDVEDADSQAEEGEDDGEEDADVEVSGALEALTDSTLGVRGLVFSLDEGTRFFLDDLPVTAAEFRAAAQIGDPVEVDALPAGDGSLRAVKVELEAPATPEEPPMSTAPEAIRYRDIVFDAVEVRREVVFAAGATTEAGVIDLKMDVFSPAGDDARDRPVLLVAFGGGFVGGDRGEVEGIARAFARRGYVSATFDYRVLAAPPESSQALLEAGLAAVHDAFAVVRFFRADAMGEDLFGTRADSIFIAGESAGGVIAAVAASFDPEDAFADARVTSYLRANGGVFGQVGAHRDVGSRIQGALALSGATFDLGAVDETSAPLYAAHDALDPVVPCGTGPEGASFTGLVVSGSCELVPTWVQAGVAAELFLLPDSDGHLSFDDREREIIYQEAAVFFHEQVLRAGG